eukprot:GHVT01017187.1.p1 GENE.GHVT01017187.1~~GHVT01017187.1.p1  ORF type:complete len:468 (-),score=48.76 GHVT01017187.1:553-1956(-)
MAPSLTSGAGRRARGSISSTIAISTVEESDMTASPATATSGGSTVGKPHVDHLSASMLDLSNSTSPPSPPSSPSSPGAMKMVPMTKSSGSPHQMLSPSALAAKEAIEAAAMPSQRRRLFGMTLGPYTLGAVVVLGMYLSFLLFGLVQERVYHIGDAENGGKFTYSIFLVLVMCICNSIISFTAFTAENNWNFKAMFKQVDSYAVQQLALTSISYTLAMLCTNYALTHVNYPTQVLVKSAKMVPIVIGGFLVFGKTYPWYDYVSVAVVTVSLAVFNMMRMSSSSGHQTITGLLLLVVSLVCDGMTGPRQDRLLAKYKHLGPLAMMFFLNVFAALWAGLACVGLEGVQPILFCARHPETVKYLAAFAISGCIGQLFVFQSLRAFGSLYTSLFTTLRKATSTIVSVYLFGHRMSLVQWLCVLAIFLTLLTQSFLSKQRKGKTHLTSKPHQPQHYLHHHHDHAHKHKARID